MPDINPDDYSDVISEVRFITDYTDFVFTDTDIQEAIEFSMREIRAILENPGQSFEDTDEDYNARRALMWATCYHLKVKTGELGGMPMSIGDVNMSYFSDRGEHYSNVMNWLQEFQKYLDRLTGSPSNFAHSATGRSGRQYEHEKIGDAYGYDL